MKNTQRITHNAKRMAIFFTLIIICLILPQAAQAATYYVDIDGVGEDGIPGTADDVISSDDNPGTAELPWKTINRAVEGNSLVPNVVAGDTVYIRNGTYAAATFNYVPSVEPSAWTDVITYQAATGHNPKISSNVGDVPALTITGLYKRYLDFNGIDMEMVVQRVYPSSSSVVYIERSGYIKIRNCSITGYWTTDIGGPPDDANAENSITSYGIWSRGYTSTINNDLQFDNLEITQMQQGIATTEYFGTGFKVTNCKIHKTANSPICINYNANPNHGEILIQGNEFYDEQAKWQVSNPYDWSHGAIYCINNNTTFRNNIIHSCGASSGIFFSTNSDIRAGGGYSDILIENNLIYDTISTLGLIRFYELGDGSIIIRNNTIIGSQIGSNGNIYDYYGGGTFTVNTLVEGATGAGLRFDNNILVGCFSIPVGFTGLSGEGNIMYATLDANPTAYTWSGTNTIYRIDADHTPPVDTHFITNFFANVDSQAYFRRGTDTVRYPNGGPHRTDYTTNFKLNSLSPAINYGVVAQQTSTDILGNARDASHHSAGCYEYGASGVLYGDVSGNGEISSYDAALTAQASVDLITLTPEQTKAADVSGNGEVSAYDAALIAQKAVGLIDKFPVEP